MRIFLIALSSLLVVELDAAIRVQAMLPRQRYNRDDEEDTEDEEDTSEDNEPVTVFSSKLNTFHNLICYLTDKSGSGFLLQYLLSGI